jgi:hypothetical protein
MAEAHPSVYAVGVLPDGAWLGFRRLPNGYDLAVGRASVVSFGGADANELLALAIIYFEESLDDAPVELAATQEDLADLVRWLLAVSTSAARRPLLQESLDAIDDGLPGEVVASRLDAARETTSEQADPIDLLVQRANELLEADR